MKFRKVIVKPNNIELLEQDKIMAKVKACSIIFNITAHQLKIAELKVRAKKNAIM